MVQNPILDLISKGGGAASSSFAQASQMANRADQSFQRGASMALKMDQLLQEEEARLTNNVMNAQKNMQAGLNNALNTQFKQQAQALKEQQFAENKSQFKQTLDQNKVEAGDLNDYRTSSLEIQDKKLKVAENTLALQKEKYQGELKLKKQQMDYTNNILTGGPSGGSAKTTTTTPVEEAPFTMPELDADAITNYKSAVTSLATAAKDKVTVSPDEITAIKAKLDPKYHKAIDSVYSNMSKTSKAPSTLSKDKSQLTEPQQRQGIQSRIEQLRAAKGGVAGNTGQSARFDQQIKSLQDKYKKLSPSGSSFKAWSDAKFKANPNMNEAEFVQSVDEYSRNQFFDKDDKARFDKATSVAWKAYETKQKEGAARRLGYESANQADVGTPEYNTNNNLALLTQRDEGLSKLLPLENVQANQDSMFSFMSDQSFLESGIGGLANNEQLAGQVAKQLLSSKDAVAAMGDKVASDLRAARKAGDDDAVEHILTTWLESADTEAEIKKQFQLR